MTNNDFTFLPPQQPSPVTPISSGQKLQRAASPANEIALHTETAARAVLSTIQAASTLTTTPVTAAQILALPKQKGETPSSNQMVRDAVKTLNDVPFDENAPIPKTGVLVTEPPNTGPIGAPVKPLSPEKALLKASRSNNRAEFQNIILSLKKEGKEIGPLIQSVLKTLAEKEEFAEHCFAFSEIVRLMPHLTKFEYKPPDLTAKELSGRLFRQALSGIKSTSLKDANKALISLAGDPELYFEALKTVKALYSPDEAKKLILDTAPELLKEVRKKDDPTFYCSILNSLSKFHPGISDLILEDSEGLVQTDSIDLVVQGLQLEGILSKECSTDVYEKAIHAKEAAEGQSSAKKMLETVAKTGNTTLYGFALNELSKLYPEITSLVNPQGTLEPEGIRLIIKHLKDVGKMNSDLPCIVYDNMDDCIEGLIKETSDPKITRLSVIVRHEGSSHVTPILLEKSGDTWKALITDSTGLMINPKTGKNWDQAVGKMLREAIPNVTVCSTDCQRQNSAVGCPMFAILDVVQFSKTPNLLQDKEGKFRKSPTLSRDFILNELPSAMMRPTQSLKKLAEYRKEDKSIERAALAKTIKRHTASLLTAKGPTKPLNCLAKHRFNTYSNLLVASVIGAAPK